MQLTVFCNVGAHVFPELYAIGAPSLTLILVYALNISQTKYCTRLHDAQRSYENNRSKPSPKIHPVFRSCIRTAEIVSMYIRACTMCMRVPKRVPMRVPHAHPLACWRLHITYLCL